MPGEAYTWQFRAEGGQEANTLLRVIERLDKSLQRFTQRESEVQGAFRSIGNSSRAASESTRKFTSAVSNVTKETVKTASGITTISTEYDRMGKVVRRTVDDVNTLGSTTAKTRRIFDGQGNVVKQTSETLTDYRNKVVKASDATRQSATATETATKSKISLFQVLTKGAGIWNTWNKAVDFAAKRIRQLYDGFTALFSKVQEIGGSFERTRATMEVLAKSSGANADEIGRLTSKTKELGRTTEFTAQQAADGAVTLLKAGESASGAYNKLGVALDGALATGLKVDKVAAIGNHAMKIFGDNLGKVGDRTMDYSTAMKVMIASANAADVTVSQLDQSLVKGGDIMARLGVPLTRVNTALGLLANKGITGSQAMRMLSISTKRMVDGTRPAQVALETLGVSAVDSGGNLRDIGELMQDLGDALDLRKPNEQIKLMKDLFGAGDKVMGTLIDAGVSGFDSLEGKIQDALDVMDELKEARADTMIGSFKQFQSAVEGVYVELSGVLGLPIKEFWQTLANILNIVSSRIIDVAKNFNESGAGLQEWIDAIKSGSFDGIFSGLTEELRPEIDTLKTLFKGLIDIVLQLFKQGAADIAIELWDAIFTDDIKAKAAEFGIAVGNAILKGMLETNLGQVVGGAFALNLIASATSAIGAIKGMFATAGAAGAAGSAGAAGFMALPTAGAVLATAGTAAGVGAVAYGGMKIAEGVYDAKTAKEDQRGIDALKDHLDKMLALKKEVSAIPLTERTEQDQQKLQNINRQIMQTGDQLRQIQDDLSGGYAGAQADKARVEYEAVAETQYKSQAAIDARVQAQIEAAEAKNIEEGKAKAKKPIDWSKEWVPPEEREKTAEEKKFGSNRIYLEAGRAENERRAAIEQERRLKIETLKEEGLSGGAAQKQLRIDEAMAKAKAGQAKFQVEESPLADATDAQLQAKQAILSKQEELINAEKRQKEAIEDANAVLHETQIEINNAGAAFEKWLLSPVDVFQQKMMGIREGFGQLVDGLRGKRVDVAEKFGLVGGEQAAQQRQQNLQKSLDRDKKLMEMAQTPEEEQKIQERMADKLTKMAEASTGPEQQQFAQQAERMYARSEESAGKAEELELKRVEIERETAQKNLAEYESLAEGAETAGSRAAYLEQLQGAYMMLGPEYREKAVETQAELKRAKTEAAAEESETFKRIAEAGEVQVEELKRAVELLTKISQTEDERVTLEPDRGYQMQ